MKETNLTSWDIISLKTSINNIINVLDKLDDVGYEIVNDYALDDEGGRYQDMLDWLQYLNGIRL